MSIFSKNGISILPDTVQTLHRTGVVYRPISERATADRLAVLWRKNDASQIVKNFIQIAKKVSKFD